MAVQIAVEHYTDETTNPEQYYQEHIETCNKHWKLVDDPNSSAVLPHSFNKWLQLSDGDGADCETHYGLPFTLSPSIDDVSRHVMAEHVTKLQWMGKAADADAVAEQGVLRGLFRSKWQRPARHYNNMLRAKPVWMSADDPWLESVIFHLENALPRVRDELIGLLGSDFEQNSVSAEHDLTDIGQWKVFYLFSQGSKVTENAQIAPIATKTIEHLQLASSGVAYFSRMIPGTHVKPHTGKYNTSLRMHCALLVEDSSSTPTLRVANQTFTWHEGKCFALDDSFEHEVHHTGKQDRIVLILDIKHPDLIAPDLINNPVS